MKCLFLHKGCPYNYNQHNLQHSYGWISPDGIFYGCEKYEHIKRSEFLLPNYPNSEAKLEYDRWIKVSEELNDKIICFGKVTQAQIDILSDWCIVHCFKFPHEYIDNFL